MQNEKVQKERGDLPRLPDVRGSNVCRKFRFLDKKEAETSVNHIGNKKKKAVRVYYCDKCEAWHVSSKKHKINRDIHELISALNSLKITRSKDSYHVCKKWFELVSKHFEK